MKRIKYILLSMTVLFIVLSFNFTLSDCSEKCSEWNWGYSTQEFKRYSVGTRLYTPKGIPYDPSGQNISPELIDEITDDVEKCMLEEFTGGTIPSDVSAASTCHSSNISFDRGSFTVLIPNDWVLSCDKSQQMLDPVQIGANGCTQKGLTPTETCPCRWRAGIKCPNILITTPSLYLYPDILIRYATGCQNPWNSRISKCASPRTLPLSNGTKE